MANSEMTEHISPSNIELFCVRSLPETELATVARHLAECSDCHRQLVATLGRHRGVADLSFTLAPEFWLRHEHIDYEQLVELADNKLDATDRELIDLHLKVCPPCREDVRSFLAFREQIAPELKVSYAPVEREPAREGRTWSSWWRGLAWKPIYAAAVVVIGIAIVIGAALFLKRRAENLQVRQVPTPQVSPGSTPDNRAANAPSPPATPNESPTEKPNSSEAIVVLNDRGGTITVDRSGDVVGLDDVPAPTRDEIAKVLMSERLEQPAILKELGGEQGSLRGSKNTTPFRLTSPLRTVIVTDRPTLKWEKASGASSYRVYVNDQAGHEVARSEELPPELTEWRLPKPLKRGEIYVWTVMAVVDGKEIVSPGPSSPEMKFQVLSTSGLGQLNKLKKTRSHLALGVFYAHEGMIADAEREFRILVRDNPRSPHANRLLGQLGSWQRR
jgi:predicted anti-sigma-YlaC factor YlaD